MGPVDNPRERTLFLQMKALLSQPISSRKHWGFVCVVALLFVFIPQRTPNDWELNASGLWESGIHLYEDPNYVYPPWGLLVLLPYFAMTAAGSRVLSVLTLGWLCQRRGWTLSRLLAILVGPYFLWTMSLSNVDVLALVLPVLLWETSEGTRWQSVGRGVALSIFLIKPQAAVAIMLYLFWTNRKRWKELVLPLALVALIIVPISFVGHPPLLLQWWDNVQHPSPQNVLYWSINNVSLTDHLNPLVAILVVAAALGSLLTALRLRRKPWTRDHTLATMFLLSMLLSSYASNQSMIAMLAFVPSWPSAVVQYLIFGVAGQFGIFRENLAWWALLAGITALYLFRPLVLTDPAKSMDK